MRCFLPLAAALAAAAPAAPALADPPGLPEPLSSVPGDPVRGRAIVVDRSRGLCLLCHSGPFPDQPVQGNLSPDLSGVGGRYSAAELRLRIADGRRINPETIMPAYFATGGLARVGAAWAGRTILSAGEVEDVVAFLATLREERR